MDSNLATIYLSIFVGLLLIAVVSIFRQVFKTRRLESSMSRLRNKLTKEKGTSQEYYELGSIYSEKKVFSQAISFFQKAIKAAEEEGEENVAYIYNGLGYAYFAQEQFDLAIRQYKEALKNKPDYVTAFNNLGHAYERKKLNAQALEAYEEALKLQPNNTTAKRRSESLRRLVSA
ncbi:tetratricopeptide repeat protein [Mastigocladopsis repens]|uniref:tetratricopeptide repeat protein n=1 Tax=Mastigocladopsis repens TaxID=221287 RepID=UPI0002D80771|nr:tetratricopeptide repeat protein [Mastigocladopsis repens]